ncbi:unnamed protein product [Protopolystoma xenopodis]|uniref:Uncharacterized protein n=1 Tax=Protopolystoma xenopodis TaxID=117903 RepID=A0A448WK08_9PLAT|nr:unnamed protein product [Protopolystoma xenopodis]
MTENDTNFLHSPTGILAKNELSEGGTVSGIELNAEDSVISPKNLEATLEVATIPNRPRARDGPFAIVRTKPVLSRASLAGSAFLTAHISQQSGVKDGASCASTPKCGEEIGLANPVTDPVSPQASQPVSPGGLRCQVEADGCLSGVNEALTSNGKTPPRPTEAPRPSNLPKRQF